MPAEITSPLVSVMPIPFASFFCVRFCPHSGQNFSISKEVYNHMCVNISQNNCMKDK